MATAQNPNNITFNKHDELIVEYDLRTTNFVTDLGLLKKDAKQYKVLASELHRLEKLLADETEIEEMKAKTTQFNLSKARKVKTMGEKLEVGTDKYEQELYSFIDRNAPATKFFEENGRDPKPLTKLVIVDNLGPRANDIAALQHQSVNLQQNQMEMFAKMFQMQTEKDTLLVQLKAELDEMKKQLNGNNNNKK